MRRVKKPLGIILLLTVICFGGVNAFADGVTEIPTRTITQPPSDPAAPSDPTSSTSSFAELVNYMIEILPL